VATVVAMAILMLPELTVAATPLFYAGCGTCRSFPPMKLTVLGMTKAFPT
jgi:hypothetical protein